MSNLKPDIFPKKKETKAYYIETQVDSLIVPEAPDVPKLSLDDLKAHLDDLSKGFTNEELTLYKYMALSSRLTINVSDTRNYVKLFIQVLMSSLKYTFPEKTFDELENSLGNVEILLEKSVKDGNLPNTTFIHGLMGMMRGLI